MNLTGICEVQRQSSRHKMARHNLSIPSGNHCTSDREPLQENSKVKIDQTFMQARTVGSVVANHTQEFSLMSVDVSRADHHVNALRLVSRQLLEDCGGGGDAGQLRC